MRSIIALAFLALFTRTSTFALKGDEGFSSKVDGLFKSSARRNVVITEHPYQVSIQYSFYGHICGGVILSDRWILTSARCVYNFDPAQMSILAGTVALDDETNGVRKTVQDAIIYPEYSESRMPENDIALLQLSEALVLGDTMKAANLPDQDFEPLLPLDCSVTGWGADEHLGDVPFDLRLQPVTTVGKQLCANTFSILNITLPDATQCARDGFLGGIGPCTGEWGSPMICRDVLNENLLLLGLVSGDPLPCGQEISGYDFPFLFSKVSFYTDWIRLYVNKQPEPNLLSESKTEPVQEEDDFENAIP